MRIKRFVIFASLILGVHVVCAQSASVTGDYIEARSSHVYTCGCLFSGEEVTSGREAILSWRIETGTWNGVVLKDLSVVAVIAGKENLGDPRDVSRRSILYVDETATEEERNALLNLFRDRLSHLLGDIVSVHGEPIVWESHKKSPWVMVPGKIEVSVRRWRPEDAHLGSSLWYGPFVELTGATMATTEVYSYQDTELGHRWTDFEPRIAGYFGRFVLW